MKRVRIRVSLTAAIIGLILLVALALLWANVSAGEEVVEVLGTRYLDKTEALVEARLDRFFQSVLTSLRGAQSMSRDGVMLPENWKTCNSVYLPILRALPQITSLATGDETGYSYRIGADGENYKVRLTPAGEYGPGRTAAFHIVAPDGEVVRSYDKVTKFEPRQRPWYHGARAALEDAGSVDDAKVFWTDPFILNTSKNPGIAAALPFRRPDGPVHMMTFNLMLTKLSDFTSSLRPTPAGKAFLLGPDKEGVLRVIGLPQDDRYPTTESRTALIKSLDNKMPTLENLGHRALTEAATFFAEAAEGTEPLKRRIEVEDDAWRVSAHPYTLSEDKRLWVAVAVPESDLLGPVVAQRKQILWISLAAVLGAALLSWLLAHIYGAPLKRLASDAARMTRLELEDQEAVESHVLEVHQLAESHDQMRDALTSFSRYVPTGVVRQLLDQGEAAQLGGRTRDVTVLFSDVRGFTTISESMSPDDLTQHMATYFGALMQCIEARGGAIDKMIGDAIMALFGAPTASDTHVADAVHAVLDMVAWLNTFNAQCEASGEPPLVTGLGLACGPAFVGNIGARERLNYTALGDTVNLASRLEGATKQMGCDVLCSEDVVAAAGNGFVWRKIDKIAVKGKSVPVGVYEPLGREGEVDAALATFGRQYDAALNAYHGRSFEDALVQLDALDPARHTDASVLRLQQLCHWYLSDAPPGDWDGVARLTIK